MNTNVNANLISVEAQSVQVSLLVLAVLFKLEDLALWLLGLSLLVRAEPPTYLDKSNQLTTGAMMYAFINSRSDRTYPDDII
jgi:hypothetical protein